MKMLKIFRINFSTKKLEQKQQQNLRIRFLFYFCIFTAKYEKNPYPLPGKLVF